LRTSRVPRLACLTSSTRAIHGGGRTRDRTTFGQSEERGGVTDDSSAGWDATVGAEAGGPRGLSLLWYPAAFITHNMVAQRAPVRSSRKSHNHMVGFLWPTKIVQAHKVEAQAVEAYEGKFDDISAAPAPQAAEGESTQTGNACRLSVFLRAAFVAFALGSLATALAIFGGHWIWGGPCYNFRWCPNVSWTPER